MTLSPLSGSLKSLGIAPRMHTAYARRVVATQTANLLGYWPLMESAGTVGLDFSGNGRNGTYSGSLVYGDTGIGDGWTSPYFEGTNCQLNVTTSMTGVFNGLEGTIMIWARRPNWTDALRDALTCQSVTGSWLTFRGTSSGQMVLSYIGGGIERSIFITGLSGNGWYCFTQSWSKSTDQVKAYKNGVQSGSTLTGLGTWTGEVSFFRIGFRSYWWLGNLAHCAIWNTALSDAQVLALGSV